MYRYFSIIFIFVSACNFTISQDTLFTNIYFEVDSHSANSKELLKIDSLLSKTKEIKKVYLSGHTDSDASDSYNIDLSKKRVNSINQYLKGKVNIPIQSDYFGEQKPAFSNEEEGGKKNNRRVEVMLIHDKPTTPIKSNTLTLQDVYDELSVETQNIRIRTDRDTILILKEGSVIQINAFTFDTPSQFANVEIKEVYSFVGMIGERLSTTSDGRILETGGMMKITVYNEMGEKIEAQKNINIFMPTTEFKEDMELFYGEHDSLQTMNWELNNGSSDARGAIFFPSGIFSNTSLIPPIGQEECKFFFCKIERGLRFFGNIFSRRNRFQGPELRFVYNDSIQRLMDSLGINNVYELQNVLRNQRVEQGEGSSADLGFYGFSTSRLGWINCDRFRNYSPLITMKTDLDVSSEKFTTLVFKEEKCLLPASRLGGKFGFSSIPTKKPVYYVVMETKNDKVLLSIVDTTTSIQAPETKFEEIELSNLKSRLLKLEE
ncbi:OmpA family protein [Brumimicrobium mesophilum]|uniref:OmpA family protein n=1 Tax=Brumimicrobium mesophilum TaxID=392717 RepID=UPI000D13F31E|nr:OmpA family protein [Brumimicrobium mesophilum]